jgi:hypothetical protein
MSESGMNERYFLRGIEELRVIDRYIRMYDVWVQSPNSQIAAWFAITGCTAVAVGVTGTLHFSVSRIG